jgi:hypothetical protein
MKPPESAATDYLSNGKIILIIALIIINAMVFVFVTTRVNAQLPRTDIHDQYANAPASDNN